MKPYAPLLLSSAAGSALRFGLGPQPADAGRGWHPGKPGVVEKGALADLLLVDGNPLEDLRLVADPEKIFVVIMKDGKVVKNLTSR